jgi:aryl-alcohol dehydrogenase-like predicted oxidoreductase
VIIGTKVSKRPRFKWLPAANVAAAADASLKRLQTDYIDVYHAHFDDRSSGCEPPAVLQPQYNLVARQPYEREIASVAASAGLAVVPHFALAAGFLTGKYRNKPRRAAPTTLIGGLVTGKHRRKRYEFGAQIRRQMASKYSTHAGLAVIDALDGIASAHGVAIATVAIAWLCGRPNVAAPITIARTAEQLPPLLAAATPRSLTQTVGRSLSVVPNAMKDAGQSSAAPRWGCRPPSEAATPPRVPSGKKVRDTGAGW